MSEKTVSLAKTTRPELSQALLRELLLGRIDEGVKRSVVWISGPPGAGKTTLVASYLENRDCPYLWYQIDRGDADVATFFLYLSQALSKHFGESGKPLPGFSPEFAADLESFSRRYFRELFSRVRQPFVVVLDNYQAVGIPSVLHDAICNGLEEIPKGCAVIMTSRTEPPGMLARLRANQVLELIDAEQLRLSQDEIRDVVELRGQTLSDDALESLYRKTQGWAAAIVLMLEHHKTGGPIEILPSHSTPQVIFDYLAGEIFDNFEPDTQRFLLDVSVLPRMTATVAESLTGEPEASALLVNLTRNDYFVSETRTSAGEDYQFHPLLREFLFERIAQSTSAPRLRELRTKAASLLRDSGQFDAAVDVLGENDDWDQVADIINEQARVLLGQGRGETLSQWLEGLPEEILQQRPWLLYWSGAARFHVSPRESRRYYEQGFSLFEALGKTEAKGTILSCCGVIGTILYELDDLSLLDRWIETLERALHQYPEALSKSMEARVTSNMFMSLVLRRPGHPDIHQWMERAARVSQESTDPTTRFAIEPLLAVSIMWTGHYSRAHDVIASLRTFTTSVGSPALAVITLKVIESMYHMLRGDSESCLSAVEQGLEATESQGVRLWGNQLLVNKAGGLLGTGDLDGAADVLDQLSAMTEGTRRLDACLLHYFRAWHCMLNDDVLGAFQQQKRALSLALEVGLPFVEVLCRLGLAQVLYACGDDRKGRLQLRKVHQLARDINNHLLEFMALLVFAYIALDNGKDRPGLNSLRYAMALGREYDYTHFLWWQPKMMTTLCARSLAEGIEEDYVRKLITTRGLFPAAPPFGETRWPWKFRIHTLSSFKLVIDDKVQRFSGKAPVRPLELLKVLVASGGKDVRAEQLAETMWPHVDGDYAHRSFTITLHRLRKLLGADGSVLLEDGRVSLNPKQVWTDVWALEHLFGKVDSCFRKDSRDVGESTVSALAESVLGVYPGSFLNDETEQPCYIAFREHLRGKFMRVVGKLGRYWEERGQWERALDYYERAVDADKLSEGFYRHMMLSLHELGRDTQAVEVYEQCRTVLSASLKLSPSSETDAILKQILRKE